MGMSESPSLRALLGVISGPSLDRLIRLPIFPQVLAALDLDPGPAGMLAILRKSGAITPEEADAILRLFDPPRPPAPPGPLHVFARPDPRVPARPAAVRVFILPPQRGTSMARVFAEFAPIVESDVAGDKVTSHALTVSVEGQPDRELTATLEDTIVNEAGATVPGIGLGSYPALAVLTISHRTVNVTGESEPTVIEFEVPAEPVVGTVPAAPDPLRVFALPD